MAGLERFKDAKVFKKETVQLNIAEKVTTIGNVQLSDDEVQALLMSPKFSTFAKMVEEEYNAEVLSSGVKHRWEESRRDDQVDTEMDKVEEERIPREMNLAEAKSRQSFDPTSKELNMQKMKVTDSKHNTRVILAQPMPAIKESMVGVRQNEWAKIRSQFKEEFCDEEGNQKSNLTAPQRRGIKSLVIRVKNGEIVILETDKSGKLVVMLLEDYLAAGLVHTSKAK